MLSTYVGYFTGKQCWYDSSGAFFKWLRHLRKSTKDLRHLKIEELSGSCQETIITCHMHAGWWVKNMNNKLKVETRWQKWNLTLWFKTSVARKGDTWHTHDFDTVALGATSKGQVSHSVVKNGKRQHKLPQWGNEEQEVRNKIWSKYLNIKPTRALSLLQLQPKEIQELA